MFEQEEKDAGSTEGVDSEDDYEGEGEKDALADEDEEGDTLTPTKRGQTAAAAAAAAAAATTLPISSDLRVFRRLTKGDANEVESGGQVARCANKPARKTKTICEGSQSLVN